MNRRAMLHALTLLGLFSAPLAILAQQPAKVYRVGILYEGARLHRYVPEFVRGLRELGYREGENLKLEYRSTEGRDELAPLAMELATLKVDAIFAYGTPAALAAKGATTTIPIVFGPVAEPVKAGVVASLARPGGNLTGTTHIPSDLIGKLLELLKETAPAAKHVAVLSSSTNPSTATVLHALEAAARPQGVKIQVVDIRRREDIAAAFAALARNKPDALIVTRGAPVTPAEVTGFAATTRLPAIYESSDFTEAGGLMSYGPNISDLCRRAAGYVDRILKSAKPADLPVEQPTTFDLVINLKTAKSLGLKIPQSVLLRTTRVIE
ncbi:MAG: ABC transporter substrate-binding protein [Betaproteobacteria bacterium]|nr:ABC transporter substrate-binding protein [Betaproteobacteria bacterium]